MILLTLFDPPPSPSPLSCKVISKETAFTSRNESWISWESCRIITIQNKVMRCISGESFFFISSKKIRRSYSVLLQRDISQWYTRLSALEHYYRHTIKHIYKHYVNIKQHKQWNIYFYSDEELLSEWFYPEPRTSWLSASLVLILEMSPPRPEWRPGFYREILRFMVETNTAIKCRGNQLVTFWGLSCHHILIYTYMDK